MSEKTQAPPEIEVSKMSVRSIGCKPIGSEKATPLCQILGKATGIKIGENKVTGDTWTAITGDFLAIVIATGERFRSGKLFLPSGIQDRVEAMLKDGDGTQVRFAMEIRSIAAKNPIGYSYQAVNLMPLEAVTDPLQDIINSVSGQLALPPAGIKITENADKKK